MSLDLINQLWKLLKPSIEAGDVDTASENLVTYLVEECEFSPAEIKQLFRGDSDIKDALSFYLETPDDGIYHESSYDDDDDIGYFDTDLDDDY